MWLTGGAELAARVAVGASLVLAHEDAEAAAGAIALALGERQPATDVRVVPRACSPFIRTTSSV